MYRTADVMLVFYYWQVAIKMQSSLLPHFVADIQFCRQYSTTSDSRFKASFFPDHVATKVSARIKLMIKVLKSNKNRPILMSKSSEHL